MIRTMPLVTLTLRGLVDRRRFWVMVLLSAVPVLIAIVGRAFGEGMSSVDIFDPLVVSTVLVSTGRAWCLALWLVSIGTAQWAAFRVLIWTEHAGLPEGQTHRFHANWWQRWLFFPMNTWCHYEHHASAATPFYRLPALRRELDAVPILTVGQVFELLARAPASDQTATAR